MGALGWKTITGSVLLAVGGALKELDGCVGICQTLSQALLFGGTILAGVGVRSAIAKAGTKCLLVVCGSLLLASSALAENNAYLGLKGSRLNGPDEISASVEGGFEHQERHFSLWARYEIHDLLSEDEPYPFESTFGAGVAAYMTREVMDTDFTFYTGPEILRPSGPRSPYESSTESDKGVWAGSWITGVEVAFSPGFVDVCYRVLDPLTDSEVFDDLNSTVSIMGGVYLSDLVKGKEKE